MTRKQMVSFGLKAVLSAGLITAFFAFGKINLKEIATILSHAKIGWLLAAASLHASGLFFSAWRWQQLLLAQEISVPLFTLFKFYLVGGFFNTFLPGRIGGDLVRIYDTSKVKQSSMEPLAVILVERGTGFLTLLSLSAIVMVLKINVGFDTGNFAGQFWVSFLFLVGVVMAILIMLKPELAKFPLKLFNYRWLRRFRDHANRLYQALIIYKNKPGYILRALAAGGLLQINYIFHFYFIGRTLGFDHVRLAFFFFAIPIQSVLLTAPFFINGIGLRESIDMFFFKQVGISASSAVSFSWLTLFLEMCVALFGGIIYVTRAKNNPS